MARPSQMSLERAYYQDFAQHCPLAPTGEVKFSDKPDVLVSGKSVLGIELANIYHKDGKDKTSEQVQSGLRSEAIRIAESLYRDDRNPHYEFWFDFNPEFPIANTQELAKRLYKCVLQVIREQRELTHYKGFEECPELRCLTYTGTEYINAKWQPIQIHDVPMLNEERVLEIIGSKSVKAQSYQRCDRYWLLLIVEFWSPAQDQHLTWNPAIRIGSTPFEKIIIYKPASREWLEVPQ